MDPKKAAHQLGASAHENRERWNAAQRDDIAYYYGKDWSEMTLEERREAKAAWDQGFADNAKAHGERH